MSLLSRLKNFFQKLLHRSDAEQDLNEEIQFHIDQETKENIRKGMSPEQARKEAVKAFGGKLYMREDCRESWGIRFIDELVNDVRYGLRQVLKNKFHTCIIVLTLAICMGSNTTAYNFVTKLVNNPYEYVDIDRVVRIGKQWTKLNGDLVNQVAIPHFKLIEEQQQSFESVGFIDDEVEVDLDLGGKIRRISTDRITAGVWDVTGIKPLVGRFFTQQDIENSNGKLIVLGENLWNDLRSKGDNMLGQNVVLDSVSYEVIGVAPKSYYLGYFRSEAWTPRTFRKWETEGGQRNDHSFSMIGVRGFSQAGWIAPIVASKEPAVSYMTLLSCPTIPVPKEIKYSAIAEHDEDFFEKYSQEEIRVEIERFQFSDIFFKIVGYRMDPVKYLMNMEIPILWAFSSTRR